MQRAYGESLTMSVSCEVKRENEMNEPVVQEPFSVLPAMER